MAGEYWNIGSLPSVRLKGHTKSAKCEGTTTSASGAFGGGGSVVVAFGGGGCDSVV